MLARDFALVEETWQIELIVAMMDGAKTLSLQWLMARWPGRFEIWKLRDGKPKYRKRVMVLGAVTVLQMKTRLYGLD